MFILDVCIIHLIVTMNKDLLQARLLLQTVGHGDIPYSLPGVPGPKGMPHGHIENAVKVVDSASQKDRREVNIEINRIVYGVDRYGHRL